MSKYYILLGSENGNWHYSVRCKRIFGSDYIASFTTEKEAAEFIEERIRLEKMYK